MDAKCCLDALWECLMRHGWYILMGTDSRPASVGLNKGRPKTTKVHPAGLQEQSHQYLPMHWWWGNLGLKKEKAEACAETVVCNARNGWGWNSQQRALGLCVGQEVLSLLLGGFQTGSTWSSKCFSNLGWKFIWSPCACNSSCLGGWIRRTTSLRQM